MVLSYSIERICQLTTGAIGTALIYTLANYLIQKGKIKIGPRMMKIASYCFGIYIYQEFILRTLYYKFGAVSWLEPHILPWVGILVTLALSIMLTHFTLKTRLGRFLIG